MNDDDIDMREWDEALAAEDKYSVPASSIIPKNINWLWKHRIAGGKVQLIAGMPEAGKSMILTSLAGIMTARLKWPNNEGKLDRPLRVLLYEAEDDLEDTVVPRLIAAGANLDRVMLRTPPHAPSVDLLALYDVIMVSPMIDLANGDNNNEKDIRAAMAPWVTACAKLGTTVIGVAHCNKKADLDILHRVLGSQAWVAIVRMGWWIELDEDKDTRHILPLKGNIIPGGLKGLCCKPEEVGPLDQCVTMKFIGESEKAGRRRCAPTDFQADLLTVFGEGVHLKLGDIYRLFPDEKQGDIRKGLASLVDKGMLQRPTTGTYALP